VVPNDKTRGNGHKMKNRRVALNIRKHFFTVKVTEHWNRLPREAVEFPPLEILKSHHLGQTSLLVALLEQGFGQDDLQMSFPNSAIL